MAYVWVLSGNLRSFWRNYQRGGFAFLSVTAAELHAPVHVKSLLGYTPRPLNSVRLTSIIFGASRGVRLVGRQLRDIRRS